MTNTVLQSALSKVEGDRAGEYGPAYASLKRISVLWNAWLEVTGHKYLTPGDVAIMMGLLKTARLAFNPEHMDSYVDLAGYASLAAEAAIKEATGNESL